MYFVEGKELFCIKRDKMFIEPSAYSRWKKEQNYGVDYGKYV